MRRVALVLFALALTACATKSAAGPRKIVTESFEDGEAQVEVVLSYAPKGANQVEIVVNMQAIGINEMEQLVVDVVPEGFVIMDGVMQWAGYVPPRRPQSHRVSFKVLDGVDRPEVTVSISRSHDSHVLFQQKVVFRASGGGLVVDVEEV